MCLFSLLLLHVAQLQFWFLVWFFFFNSTFFSLYGTSKSSEKYLKVFTKNCELCLIEWKVDFYLFDKKHFRLAKEWLTQNSNKTSYLSFFAHDKKQQSKQKVTDWKWLNETNYYSQVMNNVSFILAVKTISTALD